jgi:lysophospholipase L1-like esterase
MSIQNGTDAAHISMLMGNSLTLQVANGNAFFFGLAMVVLASLCRLATEKKSLRLWMRVSAVVGATFIIASATPLSIWIYILWFAIFCLTFALPLRFRQAVIGATFVLVILSTLMWIHELGYRRSPMISVKRDQTIYVVGDSISAGIRSEKQPWPERLGNDYRLNVVNLAQAGATVESAIQQVQQIKRSNSVVIVEIGGNDFFGATKASEFANNLDHLVATLAAQGHTLAMFELPLLPFHNSFGSAQRTIATKYHVVLLPKTYMARILGRTGATIDGLHLSQSGHEAMAKMVYQTLQVETPSTPAETTALTTSSGQWAFAKTQLEKRA